MSLVFNKVTVPLGLIIILALVFLLPPMPLQTPSLSFSSGSSATTEYEIASIEVLSISQHVEGDYQEYKGGDGPEGPAPKPPKVDGPLKIYILQEATRKVIELRDQAGTVIAKITWSLSDMAGFLDDWSGPNPVWSSKVEVLNGYGGNGLALWLWKFAERIFYQPGMTRVIVDMAVTESGKTGWTSYHLPTVLNFIQQNVSSYSFLFNDPTLKVWVIQYP